LILAFAKCLPHRDADLRMTTRTAAGYWRLSY